MALQAKSETEKAETPRPRAKLFRLASLLLRAPEHARNRYLSRRSVESLRKEAETARTAAGFRKGRDPNSLDAPKNSKLQPRPVGLFSLRRLASPSAASASASASASRRERCVFQPTFPLRAAPLPELPRRCSPEEQRRPPASPPSSTPSPELLLSLSLFISIRLSS